MKIFKDDRCYRPDEVAKILNIDTKSVYRLIRDPADPLPAFRTTKPRGVLRLHGGKLNEYFEKNKIDPLEE
jgi:hypothetical protein